MDKHHGHLLVALEQVEKIDVNQISESDDVPSPQSDLRTAEDETNSPPLIKSESRRHAKNGGVITLRMPDESKNPLNNDPIASCQEDQAPADPVSASVTTVT